MLIMSQDDNGQVVTRLDHVIDNEHTARCQGGWSTPRRAEPRQLAGTSPIAKASARRSPSSPPTPATTTSPTPRNSGPPACTGMRSIAHPDTSVDHERACGVTSPTSARWDASRLRVVSRDCHPGVDAYIGALPPWQRGLCGELRELIRAADPEIEQTIKRSVTDIVRAIAERNRAGGWRKLRTAG